MSAIRRPGATSATVLIGLTASFVVAHVVAPEWSRRAGLDVWNMPTVQADYRSAVEHEREIVSGGDCAARRRDAANQVAAQLLVGSVTLERAADEACALFADDPGATSTLLVTYYHVPTERLRFARHMIERTSRLFETDEQADAVLHRLESEYCAMIATHQTATAP